MSHRLTFTYFSDTLASIDPVAFLESKDDVVSFCILQLEETPTTKKLHWQGYVEFKSKTTIAQARKLFLDGACYFAAKGTAEQNITYCSKSRTKVEGPWSIGDPRPSQGDRTDVVKFMKLCQDVGNVYDVMDIDPSNCAKYWRMANDLCKRYERQPTARQPPIVIVIHGLTGAGKSFLAREIIEEIQEDYWVQPVAADTKVVWFDKYHGQACALFDEFEPDSMTMHTFLRITDAYNVPVPVKGSHVWWNPKVIIFTSNSNPADWYPVKAAAVARRIHSFAITKFTRDEVKEAINSLIDTELKTPCSYDLGEIVDSSHKYDLDDVFEQDRFASSVPKACQLGETSAHRTALEQGPPHSSKLERIPPISELFNSESRRSRVGNIAQISIDKSMSIACHPTPSPGPSKFDQPDNININPLKSSPHKFDDEGSLIPGHENYDCKTRCEHGYKTPCCGNIDELCKICEDIEEICICEVGEFCDLCDPPTTE